MKNFSTTSHGQCDSAFAAHVREQSGVAFERCYQCLTCTLGCDAAEFMDILPHQMVRMTQLGLKDALLTSRAIWVCTSCEACVSRCPNDIDVPHLVDTLHCIALREGYRPAEPDVPVFHRAFLKPVMRYGRQYEALMTALFMVGARRFSVRDIVSNATLGIKLFVRGKLKLRPHAVKDRQAVKQLFLHSGEK